MTVPTKRIIDKKVISTKINEAAATVKIDAAVSPATSPPMVAPVKAQRIVKACTLKVTSKVREMPEKRFLIVLMARRPI